MGKIALVTGGMGGIGSAICKALAKAGYIVCTTYYHAGSELEQMSDNILAWKEMIQEAGSEGHAFLCDVSNFESCEEAGKKIKAKVGNVDILINNAGILRDTTFKKMTKDKWNDVINTNLNSAFNVTKQVLEDMLDNGWGRIINISSINGQKGQFGQTNYSAAKAGLHGFTMALAQEVANKGITVNTIAPGYIGTDMVMAISEEIRNKIIAGIPVGRLGKPEEIAALVIYLASEASAFMTGTELAINGCQHTM